MSISRENKKYLVRNFWATVFLLVFAVVYESFSHGVVSYYMIGAFLIPVIGAVPYILMEVLKKGKRIGRMPRELWQLGIFTLAQGAVIKGVIEIYGTTNRWTQYYLPAAIVFMAVAAAAAYMDIFEKTERHK